MNVELPDDFTPPQQSDPADLAPANLTAERADEDGVVLAWDAPAEDAESVTGYAVLRARGEAELTVLVADTGDAETTYTDAGATEAGATYAYRVKALRDDQTSLASNRAEVQLPPAAPTTLLTAVTHEQVVLSWDEPDDDSITGYRILRRPDADNLATLVDDTGSAAVSYTDGDVAPETTCVYAVKAINEPGTSEASESVSVTTLQAPEDPITLRQQGGVCDRTDEVETVILLKVDGLTACEDVTAAQLAHVRRVNLTFGSIDSLQSGDFSGLTGLTELILRNNSLTSLPAGYDFVSDGLKRRGAASLLNTTADTIIG